MARQRYQPIDHPPLRSHSVDFCWVWDVEWLLKKAAWGGGAHMGTQMCPHAIFGFIQRKICQYQFRSFQFYSILLYFKTKAAQFEGKLVVQNSLHESSVDGGGAETPTISNFMSNFQWGLAAPENRILCVFWCEVGSVTSPPFCMWQQAFKCLWPVSFPIIN